MKSVDDREITTWCGNVGLLRRHSQLLYPRHLEVSGLSVEVPGSYSRSIALTDRILPAEGSFGGGLVWVTAHDIWSETRTSYLFNRLRMALTLDPRDLDAAPATVFDAADEDDFRSLALLSVVGAWDTFIVPRDAGYFAGLSHDGVVDLVGTNLVELRSIAAELQSAKFRSGSVHLDRYREGANESRRQA